MRCGTEGRPAILYKSLPSLVLPAGGSSEQVRGAGEHRGTTATETDVVGGGTAIIPLKETLARRLSASVDCIDKAGDNGEKQQAPAAAAVTSSESQLGADEPRSENP